MFFPIVPAYSVSSREDSRLSICLKVSFGPLNSCNRRAGSRCCQIHHRRSTCVWCRKKTGSSYILISGKKRIIDRFPTIWRCKRIEITHNKLWDCIVRVILEPNKEFRIVLLSKNFFNLFGWYTAMQVIDVFRCYESSAETVRAGKESPLILTHLLIQPVPHSICERPIHNAMPLI